MFWWILATVLSYFVKGVCGFANTLVFTSILSFASNNINISPVDLLIGAPANFIVVWRERKSVSWRLCLPVAALVLAGSIFGALALKNVDAALIKVIFGAVVVIVGVEMLLRERQKEKSRPSRFMLAFIGLLSGVLFGLFGVGALLAAYFGRTTQDSHGFRANLCAVFAIENIFRTIVYAGMGILTLPVLRQVALLLPFMLLGLFSGMLLGKKLDERIVKRCVVVVLIISGLALILTNL